MNKGYAINSSLSSLTSTAKWLREEKQIVQMADLCEVAAVEDIYSSVQGC